MRKPVLFIPGFPASELKTTAGRSIYPPSAQTLADPDKRAKFIRAITTQPLVAGEPIREVLHGLSKQAATLYDILRAYGYSTRNQSELALIGWNWMEAVDDETVMKAIGNALEELYDGAGTVVAIAHSTGGLVLRRFLELHPDSFSKIEHIFTFGVPWGGTLKSFRYLTRGEDFGFLNAKLTAKETRQVMSHAQAAFDLLPPPPSAFAGPEDLPPALAFDATGVISPTATTRWIPPDEDCDYMRRHAQTAARLARMPLLFDDDIATKMTNVAGWGAMTDTKATIGPNGGVQFDKTKDGDGTIPIVSAAWLGNTPARTFFVPIGIYATNAIPTPHSQIWDAPPLLDLFDQILEDAPHQPFVAACIDDDDAANGGENGLTIRLSATDPNAKPLSNASVFFQGLTLKKPIAIGRKTHVDIVLEASALPPRIAPDLLRFVAVVSWDDSSGRKHREVPLILRR